MKSEGCCDSGASVILLLMWTTEPHMPRLCISSWVYMHAYKCILEYPRGI